MKNKYLGIFLLSILLTFSIVFSYAQGGPGDPGGDPSGSGDPLGGNAPVSGGMILLFILSVVYGIIKLNMSFKNKPKTTH